MMPTAIAAADTTINARLKKTAPLFRLSHERFWDRSSLCTLFKSKTFAYLCGCNFRSLAWVAARAQEEARRTTEHFCVMPSTIVAAAVQLAAHDRDTFAHGWRAAVRGLREAHALGARLAVLPEGTLPAYVMGYRAYTGAEIADAMEECRSIARETAMVIVVGAVRSAGERLFNSAIVIDADGSLAGAADKHFLWHFDRQWFSAGERIAPIQTSIGTLGALVCADGRIPTIARALADRGAEVLVMPTAWVTSGRDPEHRENVQADLFARVRARENGLPFIAANKSGIELGCVAYCGKSQIVGADGTVVALAPQADAAIIAGEITLAAKPARPPTAASTRTPKLHAPVRVALSACMWAHAPHERLRILEAGAYIGPGMVDGIDTISVDDARMFDPGAFAADRLRGFDVAVWETRSSEPWQSAFARTRAIELRMYIVVIDHSRQRAYAIDPDGTVLCGTFEGFNIACFSYDPQRTAQTFVAPGTDVREGLERALADAAR